VYFSEIYPLIEQSSERQSYKKKLLNNNQNINANPQPGWNMIFIQEK